MGAKEAMSGFAAGTVLGCAAGTWVGFTGHDFLAERKKKKEKRRQERRETIQQCLATTTCCAIAAVWVTAALR
eukprot:COSAG04_NODE_564_length_12565_cov_220.319028_15_plen_73_part_00